MNIVWHASLDEVAHIFQHAPFTWYVAGGQGLDVFLGYKTRAHSDVDIAVLHKDKDRVFQFLSSYELRVVTEPGVLLDNSSATDLTTKRHSVWVKEKDQDKWLFELLFNDSTQNEWLYRRDHTIARPLHTIGIPRGKMTVLAPEIILLYKSKELREIDNEDFVHVRPALSEQASHWLRHALQATSPGHPWIKQL